MRTLALAAGMSLSYLAVTAVPTGAAWMKRHRITTSR